MGTPAFYTKVLNYMKVGQHYYSTLYKGQEPLELLMVFNPDPSQLSLMWLVQQFILYKTHTINQKETEIEQNLEKIWTFI